MTMIASPALWVPCVSLSLEGGGVALGGVSRLGRSVVRVGARTSVRRRTFLYSNNVGGDHLGPL